jgi:hypothetical protein
MQSASAAQGPADDGDGFHLDLSGLKDGDKLEAACDVLLGKSELQVLPSAIQETLAPVLRRVAQVTSLKTGRCINSSPNAQKFASVIQMMTSLSKLDVEGSVLNANPSAEFFPYLPVKHLTHLNLNGFYMGLAGLKSLVSKFESVSESPMKELKLGRNHLGKLSVEPLKQLLKKFKHLTVLDLSAVEFHGDNPLSACLQSCDCSHIQTLVLNRINVDARSMQLIASIPNLKTLSLEEHREPWSALPPFPNLTHLSLAGTELKLADIQILKSGLVGMKSLQRLNLNKAVDSHALPPYLSIFQCLPQLLQLSLSSNNL